MEVKKDLNVSKEEFFYQIMFSVQAEYEAQTGKKIPFDKIKGGLEYVKTMTGKLRNSGNVKVVVDECVENQCYKMHVESNHGTNTIEYLIHEIDPQNIEVVYKEDFHSKSFFQKMNYKLMNIFYVKAGKRRIIAMFESMEAYIKNKDKSGEMENV